jgi:hypothetical protein
MFFEPPSDDPWERRQAKKLPTWLLTCKAFLDEGLSELYRNGEWAFYEPKEPAISHNPLFALFDASKALTVSTNMLRLGKPLCGEYGSHWVVSMNLECASARLKEALTRLEHSKATELKLGLDLQTLDGDVLFHQLGTTDAHLRIMRVPYNQLDTQSLDLSILDPVLSMGSLQKMVFTVRRMLRTPPRLTADFTQLRKDTYVQGVLNDMRGETHLVQGGMRDLARQLWGERFRERLRPVQVLEEQADLGPLECYFEFKFAEVQELFCTLN